MSYKTKIDAARKRQETHRENLKQVASEIAALKASYFNFGVNTPSLSALIEEYNQYIQLYNAEERLINELQPWFRKLTGRDY